MNTMKTKDASMLLAVSQTTIKRWASQFPSDFQKDRLGHYVFTGQQINLLLYIKDQIEQGNTLDQITLPVSPVADPEKKLKIAAVPASENELLSRIREVERSVQQKADEVVSAQVLQHRAELDELRQMVAQIAAAVEIMQGRAAKPVMQQDELRIPSFGKPSASTQVQAPDPASVRKKGFFRTFF